MTTLPYRRAIKAGGLNQYHVIAFDPGGVTGWCHLVLSVQAFSRPEHKVLANLLSWDAGEFTGQEAEILGSAVGLINAWRHPGEFNPRLDVIGEGFQLTQLVGGPELLSPVRINAVLDWECRKLGLQYKIQDRSMRTNQTKERVSEMGFVSPFSRRGTWTTTGRGKDMFAAVQHAVTWIRRLKKESISRPWKLSDGVSSNAFWDCRCEEMRSGRRMKCDLTHPR